MGRGHDDRDLTAPRLEGLLARLRPDPDEAGLEYERLRRALVRFFDWRNVSPADECADECLDRLARRLAEAASIVDVTQFAYGIARHVLLERRRQPAIVSLDRAPALPGALPSVPDEDPRQHCFDRCLATLPEDQRMLLLGYYEGERDRKIANRRRLAAELGLSEGALRSRVQRLRDGLQDCVDACCAATRRRPS
jgi:DNA-directed RNA polymerase specialized sigma24 family protein